MSTDEEVEQLLRRTRAARERVNSRMAALGESTHPIRSPLKERSNTPIRMHVGSPCSKNLSTRSPIKTAFTTAKMASPIRQRSPLRTVSSTSYKSPLKSSVTERDDGDMKERFEENYNREVSEKKTTILGSPIIEGGKEHYKKTTITEKEETISKTEVLKFTEVSSPGKGTVDPIKLLEERRNKRRQEVGSAVKNVGFNEAGNKTHDISIVDSPAMSSSQDSPSKGKMGSPSRFASCRDLSPEKLSNNWTPNKATINYKFNTEEEEDKLPEDGKEDDGSCAAGRRRRLKALANKFKKYDEEEEEIVQAKLVADAAATGSPSKRDKTKVVDVDREISVSPRRGRSPSKRSQNPDPELVKSLKAQGFEESESRSKLTYDFEKSNPSRYRSASPTKTSADHSSPYRPSPHQFICPQKSNAPATQTVPASQGQGYRSVSPTRMLDPRPTSPFKPHPLQFVSPQRANSPTKKPAPPPPKPQRTFEDRTDEEAGNCWKTEKTLIIRSPNKEVQDTTMATATESDTASRRSILEKRKMFDNRGSPTKYSPDPAMLPLSQRKALFEKNRGAAPTPIARFGQPVTPAMLSKGQQFQTPSEKVIVKEPQTEPAWKRKREASPQKYLTPSVKRSPKNDTETMALHTEERVSLSNIHKRFEHSRKLFENVDQTKKDNDISKAIQEAKRKDMEILLNRFNKHEPTAEAPAEDPPSPSKPFEREDIDMDQDEKEGHNSPNYPGVNSLKRIKVSPPRPGYIYPDLIDIHDDRPETAMSGESMATSEAPSLGAAIKRAASKSRVPSISEDGSQDDQVQTMSESIGEDNINEMLDEALDVTISPTRTVDSGPTPPKNRRQSSNSSPSGMSASSWEFQTPITAAKKQAANFKTPRIDDLGVSPARGELPIVEGDDGEATPATELLRTVSFYRKQKPTMNVNFTPHSKIVRNALPTTVHEIDESGEEDQERKEAEMLREKIRKLEEEVDEQMQRRMQSSKALEVCASKNEFEGSFERVEFERLLLEAHHKHAAASAEIRRLKTEGAKRMSMTFKTKKAGVTKGALSISGITLPLKPDFVKMLHSSHVDDSVHYFLCLVKYRAQVIATQMLSTLDGISGKSGSLVFSNLISVNDLDFDFQIYLEVYGLQTPKERLAHEVKYHIRKGKSMFNLTPFKSLRKDRTSARENPVNSMTIRKSKFGLVGYTTITIDNLSSKLFELHSVPSRSPLGGGLSMKLNVTSESQIEERGFLTMFVDMNGFGNWCRRWCLLQDNTLFFWKYPEDESKKAPSEQVSLHNCITETPISLAPREICSRMNTLMFETRRPVQHGDKGALDVFINHEKGTTTIRHLLMADTRDERIAWCDVITRNLENMRAWDPSSYRPRAASTTSESTIVTMSSTDTGDNASSASTDIW